MLQLDTKTATFRRAQAPVLSGLESLDFDLPRELEAAEPPEARGRARDEVRLMVSHYGSDRVEHTRFREL